MERNSQVSDLQPRRRPRPHSSLHQLVLASVEGTLAEEQQKNAKYVKRLSIRAISDVTFTRPIPRKKLVVRPNKVKHIRVVASTLLRSWLSHSKGAYRRSVRSRKKSKKSKEDRPVISAPGSLDWVSRPLRPAPVNPKLCPEKLGRLEEALHSNPYVPERFTGTKTRRLQVVNDTENRRRGTVFSDDFQVERETTEGRSELEGSYPQPNSPYIEASEFRRQAARRSLDTPAPVSAQQPNVGKPLSSTTHPVVEPGPATSRKHGKARRGAITTLVDPSQEEPQESTTPLNTSHTNALRRQTTRSARSHLSSPGQQRDLANLSDRAARQVGEAHSATLRDDTTVRIDASVARLVTLLPPSHRITPVQGDPEGQSQALPAQATYPGHSPPLQDDLEILERGIRKLLDERVVAQRTEKIVEHNERMAKYAEKRYRLLERETEDLRMQLNLALRRSTGTEDSLLLPRAGFGKAL